MSRGSPFRGSVCLVTGSTGFIGSVLAASLKERGAEVETTGRKESASKGDITSVANVARLFKTKRLDYVFHLAAMSSIRRSWQSPREYFDANVVGTQNMLEGLLSREDGANPPFVFASSSSVYGARGEGSISEEAPMDPVSPYGVTKVCAEVLCRGFHSAHGLQTRIARPFYVAGPGLDRGLVYEVAHEVALAEAKGVSTGRVEIADPDVVVDVVDVRDCASGLEAIAARGREGEAYNVCAGVGRSVGEIAELLASLSTAKVTVEHTGNGGRPNDTPRLVGDPSKLEGLGWRRKHRFQDTISSALESCRAKVNLRTPKRRI